MSIHSKVLALGCHVFASNQGTVADWLAEALCKLVQEGDGFNPKRPCGFSGWEGDLIGPIVEAGLASDDEQALKALQEAIVWALTSRSNEQSNPSPFVRGQVVVLQASTPERGQLRVVYDAGPADVVRVHATSEGWLSGRPEIFLAEEVQAYEAPNV